MTERDGTRETAGARTETAEEACRTLVHLLYTRRRDWEPMSSAPDGRGQLKRSLLIADYARRSLSLPPERKTVLDRLVVESFLPPDPAKPWQGVPTATDAVAAADIGIVVVIREELEASRRPPAPGTWRWPPPPGPSSNGVPPRPCSWSARRPG